MTTREELIIAVREAIWDALEEQVDMGYIDRDRKIIDTGMSDDLDMDKVAEAAINVVQRHRIAASARVATHLEESMHILRLDRE